MRVGLVTSILATAAGVGGSQVHDWRLLSYSDVGDQHLYGSAVATDGDWTVVGVPDDANGGSVRVLRREVSGSWVEWDRLTGSSASSGDRFGTSVGISGSRVIVGAPRDDDVASNAGAVYFFELSPAEDWVEVAKALPLAPNSEYGAAVAIGGDAAIVGAPFDGEEEYNAGAVYVYGHDGSGWDLGTKLTAAVHATEEARFGSSVATSSDGAELIAGSSSSIHPALIFTQVLGFWVIQGVLEPVEAGHFGRSVAIDGGWAVVGDPSNSRCHVYERTGSLWGYAQQLAQAAPDDYFAQSLSIRGDRLLVGARSEEVTVSNSGAAFLNVRTQGAWQLAETLSASDAATNDYFGESVAVGEDTLFVGAPFKNAPSGESNAGAVYAFDDDLKGGVAEVAKCHSDAGVAVSSGGTQSIHLHIGVEFAGDLTLVLGSLSGSSPGFVVGFSHLPLNPDFYTALSLTQPNSSPFENTLAFLDVDGRGEAAIELVAGIAPPALVGTKAHHAAVVLDAASLAVEASTEARMLKFLP